MQRFKNILLVTGGGSRSTRGLERAVALSVGNRAQLTVVSVLESLPRELRKMILALQPADLWQIAMDKRTEQLDRWVAQTGRESSGIAIKTLCGTAFLEVIREVLRNRHDLVMMTAEGSGGARDMLFGSTSMHLMRKCPCPVWVMKPGQRRRYARVLAAVDPIPSDEAHNSLNVSIMELAISLARIEGSALHIIHTRTPIAGSLLGITTEIRKLQREKIDQVGQHAHEQWFRELLEHFSFDDLSPVTHVEG